MKIDQAMKSLENEVRSLSIRIEEIETNSVATSNAEGAGNRLVLDYDVAFNNIHENVDASNEYFVTSGVAIYNATGDQVIKNTFYILFQHSD